MGRLKLFNAHALLLLVGLTALVLLCGCATQVRTPWGNVDMKGGSGSECSPYVAPDAGAGHALRRPAPVRPVAPVAPKVVEPVLVPVSPSAAVSRIERPPGLACLD